MDCYIITPLKHGPSGIPGHLPCVEGKAAEIKIYMGHMSVMKTVAAYFGVWKEKD